MVKKLWKFTVGVDSGGEGRDNGEEGVLEITL